MEQKLFVAYYIPCCSGYQTRSPQVEFFCLKHFNCEFYVLQQNPNLASLILSFNMKSCIDRQVKDCHVNICSLGFLWNFTDDSLGYA